MAHQARRQAALPVENTEVFKRDTYGTGLYIPTMRAPRRRCAPTLCTDIVEHRLAGRAIRIQDSAHRGIAGPSQLGIVVT